MNAVVSHKQIPPTFCFSAFQSFFVFDDASSCPPADPTPDTRFDPFYSLCIRENGEIYARICQDRHHQQQRCDGGHKQTHNTSENDKKQRKKKKKMRKRVASPSHDTAIPLMAMFDIAQGFPLWSPQALNKIGLIISIHSRNMNRLAHHIYSPGSSAQPPKPTESFQMAKKKRKPKRELSRSM